MKKILFCAAVAALATACTNEDDLVMNQDNSRVKGLTFDVTLAEGATTRGELWKDDNGTYPFFWYAETDRIDVFGINVTAGDQNTANNGVVTTVANDGVWDLTSSSVSIPPAVYKATLSAGAGQFTAQDDANMLLLKDYKSDNVAGTTATIVATYGGIAVESVKSKIDKNNAVPGELTGLVVKTAKNNATQNVVRANAVDAPMYSVSTAVKEEAYNSLGEKANLKMIRPFPVIRFTTKNTKEYISDLGKLQSVELITLGYTEDGKPAPTIDPSAVAYDLNKKYTVIGEKVGFETGFAPTSDANKVTVNLTDGTWSDDDAVYMTVAPVDRTAFRDKSQKEAFKVVYTFDNITFTLDPSRKDATAFEKEYQTSNDWTAIDKDGKPNAITPLPALDINNYNYLVTGSASDRTLIVIKGNFKDIFADKDNVAWSSEPTSKVAMNSFTKIISNVALTNEELATIKGFDGLKVLTLNENTSIPANTFSATQANNITELTLPKVTSIDEKFIANVTNAEFFALKKLIMPAYEFTNAKVNKAFFGKIQTKLETIDMSGVTSMMPTFGIERTMTFTNYTALKDVTVKDGVIVSPNGFAGCNALEKITGILDIADASDVFNMSSAANNVLKSVTVSGTIIPSGAFTNCTALKNVVCNGSTVVPTAIGANAFEGTKVQYMDLSQAATIGAAAFKGSDIASTSAKVNTMTVGATELPASIFEGCTNLKMVKFTAATKITGADVFKDADNLIQIKFEKVISLADSSVAIDYSNVFTATPGNIDFWTNPDQKGVDGNKITLSYKVGTSTKTQDYTFKSIQKKLD